MTRQSLRTALAEMIGIDLSADQHAGLRIDIHHLPGGHYDEPHTVRTVKARDLAKLLDEHAKELAHAEVCKQQQRIDHYQEQNRQLHERIKELESMTETNETTTEPTTLRNELAKSELFVGMIPTGEPDELWRRVAAIQSAIEDAATRPLREEVERLKDRVAWVTKDRDAWQMDTIAARTKHNALKARADAMRSSLQWFVDGHTPLASEATETDEAIVAYDAVETRNTVTDEQIRNIGLEVFGRHRAAEPREETHDEAQGLADARGRTGDVCVGGVSVGDDGLVATPSPDRDAQEHIDSVQAVIDGEPGALEKRYAEYDVSWTPDGMQTQIDEIRDRVTDLERLRDSDVATYRDRFNQQQRQIDSIRGGMATDKIESNEQTDRIGQVVDHVQFRLKNVEDKADALEALHAPDPNQDPALQARPCRERIDDLVTLADVAGAASDRMDAIERRHGKLRKQHRRDYDGLLTSLDTLGHRVEALEAERDPGAGPTVVTEAMCEAFVDAANSCRDPSPYAHIRAGLAAALKAGGIAL